MADAKAKTINLLLYEGDLEGVISIEDSSWNSGELYSAPRDLPHLAVSWNTFFRVLTIAS